jgi:hypothetical protein
MPGRKDVHEDRTPCVWSFCARARRGRWLQLVLGKRLSSGRSGGVGRILERRHERQQQRPGRRNRAADPLPWQLLLQPRHGVLRRRGNAGYRLLDRPIVPSWTDAFVHVGLRLRRSDVHATHADGDPARNLRPRRRRVIGFQRRRLVGGNRRRWWGYRWGCCRGCPWRRLVGGGP